MSKKTQQPQQITGEVTTSQQAPAKQEPAKMTIFEYEQKYTKRQNTRGARFALGIIAGLVAVALFTCLFFVTMRVYEINEYAGYAMIAVSVVLYICLFVVPLVKIVKLGAFETNVNANTAKRAKRHNKALRHSIADRIIDLTANVDGVGWYDSEVVGRMAIALKTSDEEKLKDALTELYKGSVKKSAKELIRRSSLKCTALTALSQSTKADTALVVMLNLQLVKDIVFLYGFRPSDARLVKIFLTVLQNALVAYGLSSAALGDSVMHTVSASMGAAIKRIPILGDLISTVIDSSVQGAVNGVLTTVIGFQTIKYLNTEYRLQNILDGVDISETPEELEKACDELEQELRTKKRPAKATA